MCPLSPSYAKELSSIHTCVYFNVVKTLETDYKFSHVPIEHADILCQHFLFHQEPNICCCLCAALATAWLSSDAEEAAV